MLVVALVFEPLLQFPAQPPVVHHAPSLLQGFPSALVDRIEANHALSLLVVKEVVLVVLASAPVHDNLSSSRPPGRDKEVGEGIRYSGPPARGAFDYTRGHGKILAVATAVAAHERYDGIGEGDIEDGGEKQRHEEALGRCKRRPADREEGTGRRLAGTSVGWGKLTLTTCVRPAMALVGGAAVAAETGGLAAT